MSNRLNIIEKYLDVARKTPEQCVDFVSDDIYLKSERDGVISGMESFRTYAKKTPLEGKWDKPERHPLKPEIVLVRGKISMMMKSIKLITVFVFDESSDKITKIIAGRVDNVKIPE